jgi:hypothetical protein
MERAGRGRGRWWLALAVVLKERAHGAAVGTIEAESGWDCGGGVHRGRPSRDRGVVSGGGAVGWSVRTVRRGLGATVAGAVGARVDGDRVPDLACSARLWCGGQFGKNASN